ncbi:PREDICTED: dynactin subunit 2 isoform X2 [Cyphomyrmex costatus]|uniref:Putative dynactin subunit 2 n=1 Tax=Cyphomyrmex costatus TaxID=456900 RepID=A0A151IQE0_9HYME|nr:PREDICTED: dynactin subunit 2 isoform X2 [Cyphomyrmex costatus]KYN08367.1 putative dynactin subunit 2 [Cyphomyrmex costatus]
MADPKYADLPGIAYDQLDVYETSDLPESEQMQMYCEDEPDSSCVEQLHISAKEAFNKFKGKQIVGKPVDFSDRLSNKPRTGYKFGDWELAGEGEKETPLQKFQRLQCEIKELYEELNELKEKSKDEEEIKSVSEIIVQTQQIEIQLVSLKLEECLGPNVIANLSDPQGTVLKQLMSQIELFKQTGMPPTKSSESKKTDESIEPGILKYQMMYLPEKARMQEAARIAQLEQRLYCLENIIGTSNDKLSKFSQNLKCQGIMEAVQQLEAKASLLDVNQLDTIETRLGTLIYRMDSIAQKRATTEQETEQEQKISEMYDIMKKMDAISQILPQTVERLLALSDIHQQAAAFSKSLIKLEELQVEISSQSESNKSLLKGVQESFASNMEVIKSNLALLDDRIKKLKLK